MMSNSDATDLVLQTQTLTVSTVAGQAIDPGSNPARKGDLNLCFIYLISYVLPFLFTTNVGQTADRLSSTVKVYG